MGYFSNGTAGEAYEAEYCSKCVHSGKEGTACNVMLAHVLYAYEECNSNSNAKHMLDLLIPVRKDSFNGRCTMFVSVETLTRRRRERAEQGQLFSRVPAIKAPPEVAEDERGPEPIVVDEDVDAEHAARPEKAPAGRT